MTNIITPKPKRVINLYAGPGTGKSTTMAALFAELKYRGYNTEMITEYAKDAAWENRSAKFFAAQDYIFGKQHFRLSRVVSECDFVVTDSPLLQNIVYGQNFPLPSLRKTIREAYDIYDNIDIFLTRSTAKPYNPKGRTQTEEQAKVIDDTILNLLEDQGVNYYKMGFSRDCVGKIINIMAAHGWLNPGT